MKHKLLFGILAALLGVGLIQSTALATDAIQPRTTNDATADAGTSTSISDHATFTSEDPTDSSTIFGFGHNLLLAGNVYEGTQSTQGLLFALGNITNFSTTSEYAFFAGNSITVSAHVAKDLFVAGNTITIEANAELGRDVYLTGNLVTVQANVPGDLSVAGNRIILSDISITGNLNINAETIVIEGTVEVGGKFVVNSNATVFNLESLTYEDIEEYENYTITVTTVDIMVSVIMGIIGLFVAFVITLAVFPGINKKVEKETTLAQSGKDLFIGLMALLVIPFICIVLLISLIGSLAGIILALVFIIMLVLAQAFAGLWLGKLIIEKCFHGQMNGYLESLIGIILIKVLGMIPYFGTLISFISVVMGFGLLLQCLRTRTPKVKGKMAQDQAETQAASDNIIHDEE